MARKKRKLVSFRTVLVFLTMVLVGYVIYKNWPDMVETFNHLHETNGFVLILLIPEQLLMYYACGQIFFSYLKSCVNIKNPSRVERLKISTELNFVNHAIPVGGIGGLAFLTYRLMPYGVSAGQASFLYVFRYAVTTVINYLQALLAIIILLVLNLIPDEAIWIIPVALVMNFGVALALGLIVFIASDRRRISFFVKAITKFSSAFIRTVTFGRKRKIFSDEKIENYFLDIHGSVLIAKRDKESLKKPLIWGMAYSFLEITTYWIVAIALGRPELLLYIMMGEAIGSVFDGIVPYGLYELGMAGVMIALGVDFPTATIVTVMTRVITLVFTIISGSWPYYKAIKEKSE